MVVGVLIMAQAIVFLLTQMKDVSFSKAMVEYDVSVHSAI